MSLIRSRVWRESQHPRDGAGRFTDGVTVVTRARRDGPGARRYRNGWPLVTGGAAQPPPGVTMMPLAEVRARLRYGPDGFGFHRDSEWLRLLQRQVDKAGTARFMADVATHGMQPLQMWEDPYDPGPLEIGNGHHRLAVAILMGAEAIPVAADDRERWDDRGGSVALRLGAEPVTELPEGADTVIAQGKALTRARGL